MQSLLNVDPARLRVVRHGPAGNLVAGLLPHTPEKIVLTVGAIQTRKNTARLIEAFAALPDDWRLILAGAAGYGAEGILAKIANNPRVQVTGYITPEALAQYYSRASIFAFPSLDEGFGMPILEAMQAGVPVITSNRSAMPEVAGDAAMLIDPENTEELAQSLTQLAADPDLRAQLSRAGKLRATQFSWSKAAQQTWAVYQELA